MSDEGVEVRKTPFDLLGGEGVVKDLVEKFYDCMSATEPQLAALHPLDELGAVSRAARDRFALFLVGWLGGPQEYMRLHGHPRLRMRHGHVPVDVRMRDAWLRCMAAALDAMDIRGETRDFLDGRFSEVANFLRNVVEPSAAGGA